MHICAALRIEQADYTLFFGKNKYVLCLWITGGVRFLRFKKGRIK